MKVKKCIKCNQIKRLDDFVTDKRNKDGKSSECKKCARLRAKIYRDKYPEKELQKCRKYRENHPERCKASKRKWNKNNREKRSTQAKIWAKNNKEKKNQINKNYIANNPEKRKAHKAVSYAVQCGKLPQIATQTCKNCGKIAQEYHHHNGYDKDHLLDVIPLCKLCHCQEHFSSN